MIKTLQKTGIGRYTKILVVVLAMAAFVGCDKKDNDNPLVGTKWQRIEPAKNDGGTPVTYTLIFTSNTKLKLEVTRGTAIGSTLGTYVYTDPDIVIVFQDGDIVDGDVKTGIVAGNSMVFTDEYGDVTFNKLLNNQ